MGGSFTLLTLPEGADKQEFLHGLADRTCSAEALQSLFGEKLKTGWRGLFGPLHWQVHFGIMVCQRSLPRVQRFIDYLEDTLEDAAGMGNLRSASRKRVAKPREKQGTR